MRSLRQKLSQKVVHEKQTYPTTLLSLVSMASALTVDTASFMEEIQQYEWLYNKFSKNVKNRDMKENCCGKIAEKFAISKLETQNKFKNTRTAYERFLRKKKIPSGSGRDTVPTVPREFTNLEWLQRYIIRRTTVSNFGGKSSQGPDIYESDEDLGDESFEFDSRRVQRGIITRRHFYS